MECVSTVPLCFHCAVILGHLTDCYLLPVDSWTHLQNHLHFQLSNNSHLCVSSVPYMRPDQRVRLQIPFTPYRAGSRKLVANFDCCTFRDIKASCNVEVKPILDDDSDNGLLEDFGFFNGLHNAHMHTHFFNHTYSHSFTYTSTHTRIVL